ncbi:MAG: ABC transporter permease, partial [bacterium]|nr:ABC transporter permease [bacterium]
MEKHFSYSRLVWNVFRKNKLAYSGIFVILFLFFVALFAPFLANNKPLIMRYNDRFYFPVLKEYRTFYGIDLKEFCSRNSLWALFPLIRYSPTEYDLTATLSPPDQKHWLGTDDRGRDVLTRIIYGTRISLSVGFVAVTIFLVIGIFIGSQAGYFGGKIDLIMSRFIELIECFPTFILILTILAFLNPSIYNIMAVIGLFGWPDVARLIRGEYLKLKKQDFVTAVRAFGFSHYRIMYNHILPNALAPILVSATFGIAGAILLESSLSFLGFGVPPPAPSWGEILSEAMNYVDFAWWLVIFP